MTIKVLSDHISVGSNSLRASSYSDPHCTATCVKVGTIWVDVVSNSKVFEDPIDSIAPVRGKRGRPRRRPEKLQAYKGYDCPRCRGFLRKRGIKARIARRGIESGQRLRRHRWVVEWTLAWLSRCRRLCVRYERRADIHEAFLVLCCARICPSFLRHAF
jgi:transposase